MPTYHVCSRTATKCVLYEATRDHVCNTLKRPQPHVDGAAMMAEFTSQSTKLALPDLRLLEFHAISSTCVALVHQTKLQGSLHWRDLVELTHMVGHSAALGAICDACPNNRPTQNEQASSVDFAKTLAHVGLVVYHACSSFRVRVSPHMTTSMKGYNLDMRGEY